MIYSLNGKWKFKNLTDDSDLYEATIPSTNYNDLLKNNLIPDPFVKLNEKETAWVGDKDWLYVKNFDISADVLNAERIELVAECLDAIAEIYVNEINLANTFNAHIAYRFNVKGLLKEGKNEIKIIFRSPVKYAENEQIRVGQRYLVKGFDKRIFIRKAQCHFDWDWGPLIPYSGITKDVYIDYGKNLLISDLNVVQDHKEKSVDLNVSFKVDGELKDKELLYYNIKIACPNGECIEKTGVLNHKVSRTITIENPILWWTHELNPIDEQALYNVEVSILDTDVRKSLNVGLRTVVLDRSKDEFGSNFRFILNGVPIFAKGANWIPADSLVDRLTSKDYAYYVDSAVFSNMNMIRVWGGGFYEDERFYDECDKKGILVWQDFCFACRPYPFFDQKFLDNVKAEISYNVERLRSHPSLALWCGNNEVEQMSNTWFWHSAFMKANRNFFWNVLEAELRKKDTVTSFIPGSPVGIDYNKAVSADNHGDNHMWVVWHGLQDVKYYRKRKTRFCSEFGFESLPDLKTIEKYADEEDYSITSKVFLAHQKCMLGNQKMEYYITSRFRLPKNFEHYVYLSQACQMECIKDATEFWRGRSRARSNGSLYWQLNDCWPVCSWSSIDYYGNYKALQYAAKHFFAPVAVSLEGNKKDVFVYVMNDTLADRDLTLKLRIVDFNKGVMEEEETRFKLLKLSTSHLLTKKVKNLEDKYSLKDICLVAELYENGQIINTKTLLFKYEKDLNLAIPNYSVKSIVKDGLIRVTVKADKFARLVRVTSRSNKPFTDNWFDLLPNEEKEIALPYYEGFDETDISVISAREIEPKGSKIYDFYKKMKFILNPVNLVVYIAQPRSHFDYKDKL